MKSSSKEGLGNLASDIAEFSFEELRLLASEVHVKLRDKGFWYYRNGNEKTAKGILEISRLFRDIEEQSEFSLKETKNGEWK